MLNAKLRTSLFKTCAWDIKRFAKLGDTTHHSDGPTTFIDNNSKILAVGHLDWVMFSKPKFNSNRTKISCPQLDDRLGVWVILHLLPYLGVNVDILLTDSEESGRSTAKDFTPPKDYNWVFEFDRAEDDVVMYDFHTQKAEEMLENMGFEVGYGAFTDICYLDIQRQAFNFGVGYKYQHTKHCYADLGMTVRMVSKFVRFYDKYKDVQMINDKHQMKSTYSYYSGSISRNDNFNYEREAKQCSSCNYSFYGPSIRDQCYKCRTSKHKCSDCGQEKYFLYNKSGGYDSSGLCYDCNKKERNDSGLGGSFLTCKFCSSKTNILRNSLCDDCYKADRLVLSNQNKEVIRYN